MTSALPVWFVWQDSHMLAAMGKDPFLVLGSEHRDIDYERVWRNHLTKVSRNKAAKTGMQQKLQTSFTDSLSAAANWACAGSRASYLHTPHVNVARLQ